MGRRITNMYIGDEVMYGGTRHEVTQVYPYIVYLKNMDTKKEFCVCLGELVIAGLQPSMISVPSR